MLSETIIVYATILLLFCMEYYLHYKFINIIKPSLEEKQKAYILSIKSSLSMFLIGIYFKIICNENDK